MTGLKLSNEEIVDLEEKIFDAYDGRVVANQVCIEIEVHNLPNQEVG